MKVLFESDLTGHDPVEVLARYLDDDRIRQAERAYAETLVEGILADQPALDALIADAAPAFPVDQLPAVDRNVLRIALHELRDRSDVPRRAAINEAVELAKAYGGDSSSRFVNGVLGTLAGRLGDQDLSEEPDQESPT